MPRRSESDSPDGDRADLSKWDIKELTLSSADPLLADGLGLLVRWKEFQDWLDLLKANDRRAAKLFVYAGDPFVGAFGIKITSFFTDRARALHLHLAIAYGKENLRNWLEDEVKKAT